VDSAVRPAIELRQPDGAPGLPDAVLALVVPSSPGPGSVRFWNGSAQQARFSWRPEGAPNWHELMLRPEEECSQVLPAT
jgi:hypothetical protein